jgi:hypothetical protein
LQIHELSRTAKHKRRRGEAGGPQGREHTAGIAADLGAQAQYRGGRRLDDDPRDANIALFNKAFLKQQNGG